MTQYCYITFLKSSSYLEPYLLIIHILQEGRERPCMELSDVPCMELFSSSACCGGSVGSWGKSVTSVMSPFISARTNSVNKNNNIIKL